MSGTYDTLLRQTGPKGKVFCMHATKAYGKRYLHSFLTLALWNWVVSCTRQTLHSRGNDSHYPLNKRLGGPQSQSGLFEEKKNASLVPGFLRYLTDLDRSLVTAQIALCTLRYSISREYGMIRSLWPLSVVGVHKLQDYKGSYLLKVYFL